MWRRTLVIIAVALTSFGVQAAIAQTEYQEFVSLDPPCRMVDTREVGYPMGYGPPNLTAFVVRPFQMTGSPPTQLCTIPANARAVAVNLTVTAGGGISLLQGHLTAYPTGGATPLVSNVNWDLGVLAEANSAIVPLSATGNMSVLSIVNTHFVMDVFGYFLDAEELLAENLAGGGLALGGDKPGPVNIGAGNVALGFQAIQNINFGNQNVGVGAHSFGNGILSGNNNIGVGFQTLLELATGNNNIAIGSFALDELVGGNGNVALGFNALTNLLTGDNNIALGINAGSVLENGTNNIYIGNPGGGANESNTIIIGNGQTQLLRLLSVNLDIDALAGLCVLVACPVLVDGNGLLSVQLSTATVKNQIQDMGEASRDLMKLRPVTFYYKPGEGGGATGLQYGLIAEEVAEVYPELVALNKSGQPGAVGYHLLPAMLLNEIQRQHRHLEGQEAKIAAQQQDIAELRARLLRLEEAKATAHQTER